MKQKVKDFVVFSILIISGVLLSAANWTWRYDLCVKLMVQSVILFAALMMAMLIDLNNQTTKEKRNEKIKH